MEEITAMGNGDTNQDVKNFSEAMMLRGLISILWKVGSVFANVPLDPLTRGAVELRLSMI